LETKLYLDPELDPESDPELITDPDPNLQLIPDPAGSESGCTTLHVSTCDASPSWGTVCATYHANSIGQRFQEGGGSALSGGCPSVTGRVKSLYHIAAFFTSHET
jgi:hypothetical protein